MKTRFVKLLVLIGFGMSACEKKTDIVFPPEGLHGPNLLALGSSVPLTVDQNYSMRANLSKQSRLKVVFTNTSNYTGAAANAPRWVTSGENSWNVGAYTNHVQEYSATRGADHADLAIKFINSPGTAKIDFYVNSNSVTRTMMVSW